MEAQHASCIYQSILNALLEPSVIINEQGIILHVNRSWLTSPIHGGDKLEVYPGNSYWDLCDGEDGLKNGMIRVLTGEIEKYKQEIHYDVNGENRSCIIRSTPLENTKSEIRGLLIVYFDITDQIKLEQIFKCGAKQYKLIAEHSKDMIKVTSVHGKVEYASPSHEVILGYNDESNIFHAIHPEDLSIIKKAYHEMTRTRECYILEVRKKKRNGDWVWLESALSPVLSDDGVLQNIIVVSREISERKQSEYELERMAYYDFLTGLYNRRKIRIIMEEALEEASIHGKKFGILIVDLDKFKQINDTHGHDIGDEVLKEFSSHFLSIKGESDIVGRLSGDEFIVLMNDISGKEDIQHFVTRLRKALYEPRITNLECNIQIKFSAGYSMYPEHGMTVKELFKHADIALYKQKKKWYEHLRLERQKKKKF